MGVFDGEEEGAEDDVEGEHAEEKSPEFGEFDEGALKHLEGGVVSRVALGFFPGFAVDAWF